ncbi:MAG: homocysteine S-methyltransferase family protein, partial [Romboutsia sp.]|nr:homocysteine S-methyltransferase family protein [Romboutsia sp.]
FTGCIPESMVKTLEDLGADAIGANCSLGPNQLIPIVKRITNIAKVPIIVQPNAGLPKIINNKAIYNINSDEFFTGIEKFIKLGASIIGGCCGTTPKYIKKISDNMNTLEKIRARKG